MRREDLRYLGFYCGGVIQPIFPRILSWEDDVSIEAFSAGALHAGAEAVGALREACHALGANDAVQVLTLSKPDDARTIVLRESIRNTAIDKNGRSVAWTMRARYVKHSALLAAPATTDELDRIGGRPLSWNKWERLRRMA